MIYCDSSFLVPLYSEEGELSVQARRIAERWVEPPLISPLAVLEFSNALHRKVHQADASAAEVEKFFGQFHRDSESGFLNRVFPNLNIAFRDAVVLTRKHTTTGGYRSLDVLHVAMARLLGAAVFLSFDQRQNTLAKAEKLKVMKLK